MSSFLEYSDTAKGNLGIFQRPYQKYQFFIEDTEELIKLSYKHLINKVFEGDFQIRTVHSLGGKSNVLFEAKQNLDKPDHIYIIDKDLNWLVNEEKIEYPVNVLELDRYCIENYFIEKSTFEEAYNFYNNDIDLSTEFEKWSNEIESDFTEAFLLVAISMKYNLGKVLKGKGQFVLPNNYKVDTNSLHKLKQALIESFNAKHPSLNFEEELNNLKTQIRNVDPKKHIISGKHLFYSLTNFAKAQLEVNNRLLDEKNMIKDFVTNMSKDEWEPLKKLVYYNTVQ